MFNNGKVLIDSTDMVHSVEIRVPSFISEKLIEKLNNVCDYMEACDAEYILKLDIVECDDDLKVENQAESVTVYLVNRWEAALRRVEKLPCLTVCTAKSDIYGLGLAVMVITDFRIITPNINLSLADRFAHVLPGMVLHRMVHQIGTAMPRSFFLYGRKLNALQAESLGVVDEVTAEVDECFRVFVENLNPQYVDDLSTRRQLLLEAPTASYDDALGVHLAACDRYLRKRNDDA